VNKQVLYDTGFSREEIIGHTAVEIGWIKNEDRVRLVEEIQTHAQITGLEMEFQAKDGRILYGWVSGEQIIVGGRPCLLTVTVDITERKKSDSLLAAERNLLNTLINNLPDSIFVKDLESKIILDNFAHRRRLGANNLDQVVEKTDFDFLPAELAVLYRADEEKVIQSGNPLTNREELFVDQDGNKRWLLTTKAPLHDQNGIITGIVGISHDITDLKQKESLLEEERNLLRTLIENLPDSVFIKDLESRVVVDNAAHRWLLGVSSLEQSVGTTDFDFFPKELAASFYAEEKQVIQSGNPLTNFEKPFIDRDGNKKWLLTTKAPLRDHNGIIVGIVGINHDITEDKQAEEALENVKVTLEAAFEQTPIPMVLVSMPDAVLRITNTACREFLGIMDEPTPVGQQLMDFKPSYLDFDAQGNLTPLTNAPLALALQGQRTINQERRIVTKNGATRWALVSGNPIYNTHGDLIAAYLALYDITERKKIQNMIESRLRLIEFAMHHSLHEVLTKTLDEVCEMTSSPIGFYHFVEPDQVTLSLQAWSTHTTQEFCKAEGNGLHYNLDQAGIWADCIRQRRPIVHNDYPSLPASQRKGIPEGHAEVVRELVVPILRNNLIVAVLGVGNKKNNYTEKDTELVAYFADVAWEIAERKQAEQQLAMHAEHLEEMVEERTHELREAQEQLVRQERLATMGQLAGSIGHELRNPLGVIANAVYFLKMSEPNASEKVKEYLDIIEKETRISDKIITDLLDFTRVKSQTPQPASVSNLIHQTLERFPAPPSVKVELDIPADLPQIYADPQHVVQVLINLVSNACQSMVSTNPSGGAENVGKLTVSASALGDMIKIKVQDTGTGISPENMKKLFEPLFTTKTKGIGLGLAVSRKLTESNGGRVEVQSELGKGSIFTVYLPKYTQEQ